MDSDIIDISSLNENVEWGASSSSNFGSGIELFMNEKKNNIKESSESIEIDDLNLLESELNELVNEDLSNPVRESKSSFFSTPSFSDSQSQPQSVRFDDNKQSYYTSQPQNIGEATANTNSDNTTWDGYGKFNNIPMNPDKAPVSNSTPHLSKEELLREKFKYLRKLETLESKGINLTKKYTMESPLAEMQGEYDMIMDEKKKQNSIKFQGNMLMACINGIEFLNNRFDPFDIKLDGWSDQINENMSDYDEIFGELFEKYKSRASMGPELKLLFQLGGSAMMIHMSNTMFKSAMPGMDDILRQNPDLMRQFQNAAVSSMSQSSPGFSGFVNNMMNQENLGGGPPPPMATQEYPSSGLRPGNNSMGRSSYSDRSESVNDGISIKERSSQQSSQPSIVEKTSRNFQQPLPPFQERVIPQNSRAEMKGPSDISDILSGLKTKTINIQVTGNSQQQQQQSQQSQQQFNDSTISITELKELQDSGNMPKKSKRRQKSDKNTLSLDI
jgi:hypothetical protein